ncbi:hypothetical protein AVEN_167360-1 [Araneus ventricosus]|uniref:Uncharacterized protein n=1 Tax=Araneus ventricosus TaxID=182803 RepID=A0A4Y2IUN8_ARAVE|nr:hypothetical protein AVEN_167360-1 [Araneus ventricosus]
MWAAGDHWDISRRHKLLYEIQITEIGPVVCAGVLLIRNQRCFAACANSAPDDDRLWMLAMFNHCRGARSVYRPDHIVLGVMSLLDGRKLRISEKESLPELTCGQSQKFSASLEPHELVFFNEKLNF